jgi:hypothetical protein
VSGFSTNKSRSSLGDGWAVCITHSICAEDKQITERLSEKRRKYVRDMPQIARSKPAMTKIQASTQFCVFFVFELSPAALQQPKGNQ